MNNSIATEVTEEMNDLPDELQQQVLKFVVTLRQQYQQTRSNGDVVKSLTKQAFQDCSSQIPVSSNGSSVDLNEFSFDVEATPIWELVAKISAEAPDEEWQKLPTDLARRFDYYQKQRPGQG
jgi:hypothetical protein